MLAAIGRGMDEETGWSPVSGLDVFLMHGAESMGYADGAIVLRE
jgi:hypothetical protein